MLYLSLKCKGIWGTLSPSPFPMLTTSAMNCNWITLNSRGKNSELEKTYTSFIFQQLGLYVFSMCVFIGKGELLRMPKCEGREEVISRTRRNFGVRGVICRTGINGFL